MQVENEQVTDKAKIQIEARLLTVEADANEIEEFFEKEKITFPSAKDDPNYANKLTAEQADQLAHLIRINSGSKMLTAPRVKVFDDE